MNKITELAPLVCRPDTPVADVLARLSASPHLFLLVAEEDGRLCGTITDGDARRAFLLGVALDDVATACMQDDPVTGRVGEDEENKNKLANVPARPMFLPLLDDSGRVIEVLYAGETAAATGVTALVMAGGPGTRLGELTRTTPKPLLPVGDKPILEHTLERLEQDGFDSIYVSVHYLAEKIEDYVRRRDNVARIELLHEELRLGTAGAVGQLPESEDKEVLVINGDIITRVNFRALRQYHREHGHDATISVASYQVDIPFGIVRQDEDGLFLGIEEKPRHTYMVAAGIYLLSPRVTALVPPDGPIDMPELLNRGRSIGLKVGVFPIHEYWVDVGRPDDLEVAKHDHLNGATESGR